MPYFAHVIDGQVKKVERIDASVMIDSNDKEQETLGQAYLGSLYPGTKASDYVLTTYSPDGSPVPRGKYAGTGDTWDGTAFAPPPAPDPATPAEALAP